MKCFADAYCKKKNESYCSELCGAYRVLRALYNLSRLPDRYRYNIVLEAKNQEDLTAFMALNDYKENVLEKVKAGEGLYIWGKSTGCGKTSWACKIMSHYFRKIAFSTGLENEGLYIFLPTFLEDIRRSYDSEDQDFEQVLSMVENCNLLIVDDIGAEKVTDWVAERVVSLIHRRYSNGLCTIYTSNLSPEELKEKMGERVASRVLGSSKVIEISGGDWRQDR